MLQYWKVLRKMEADPGFEGSGGYEKLLVRINTAFQIVFTLNDIVKNQGEVLTKEVCTFHDKNRSSD
jgi:hypothetical protein|eukprot:SAG25_NODE_395_length_8553_cov_4.407263_5_plen_67_part_00